jgi:three-Cys-motif partner protein
MTNQPTGTWKAEPHTLAKLDILRRYLGAWFSILYNVPSVGELVYIDAGCGPGQYVDGEDGSPVLALKTAALSKNPRSIKTRFYFIDHTPAILALAKENCAKVNGPINSERQFINDSIDGALPRLIDILKLLDTSSSFLIPIFVFIDGYGNASPMNLLWQILERRSSEIFILYSSKDTFRNINHPEGRTRIVEAFGTDAVLDIPEEERVLFYHKQLRRRADFVSAFEMQKTSRHTFHHLFFATNNPKGFIRMKEAMWKVDQSGDLRFSDALAASDSAIFDGNIVAPETLRHELCHQYSGKSVLCEKMRDFVELNTNYLDKHKRQVLIEMQDSKLIEKPTRIGGAPVRLHDFPRDSIITFPPRFCGCRECKLQG